jgi:hypothetical protein
MGDAVAGSASACGDGRRVVSGGGGVGRREGRGGGGEGGEGSARGRAPRDGVGISGREGHIGSPQPPTSSTKFVPVPANHVELLAGLAGADPDLAVPDGQGSHVIGLQHDRRLRPFHPEQEPRRRDPRGGGDRIAEEADETGPVPATPAISTSMETGGPGGKEGKAARTPERRPWMRREPAAPVSCRSPARVLKGGPRPPRRPGCAPPRRTPAPPPRPPPSGSPALGRRSRSPAAGDRGRARRG